MSKEITRAESKHWQSHNNNPEILIMWGRKKTILKWNHYRSKRNFNGNLVGEISYEYKVCIIYVYNIKYISSSQAYFLRFLKYICIYMYLYVHIYICTYIYTHICTQSERIHLNIRKIYTYEQREPSTRNTSIGDFDKGNSQGTMATEAGEWLWHTEVVTTSLKLNAGTLLIGHSILKWPEWSLLLSDLLLSPLWLGLHRFSNFQQSYFIRH